MFDDGYDEWDDPSEIYNRNFAIKELRASGFIIAGGQIHSFNKVKPSSQDLINIRFLERKWGYSYASQRQ